MKFYLWDFMYNILGIILMIVISIIVYKIFMTTKSDMGGDPRTA